MYHRREPPKICGPKFEKHFLSFLTGPQVLERSFISYCSLSHVSGENSVVVVVDNVTVSLRTTVISNKQTNKCSCPAAAAVSCD